MKDLTLNQKEQARLSVLNSVLEYQVSIAQAAEVLGVSPRHARRMLAAYRDQGAAALAHGNRGRRPHKATSPAEAASVVELAIQRYEGANHTHFTELLSEREGIDLSRPTVRRILTNAGIGSPRSRRSPQHRFRRERMPQAGMLVQLDGSHHAWLEDRGPKFALLLAVETPPARWPTPCFAPVRTRGATSCSWKAWSSAGAFPWRCTATAMPYSSTTPVSRRPRRKPPSSPVACRNWGYGRSAPAYPRPRVGWSAWRRPFLDFAYFKRHKRGNLQLDGTERPGVPEYLGQLRT